MAINKTKKSKAIENSMQLISNDDFVLKAKDWSTPTTIFIWMALNSTTASDEKLRSAFEQALKMRTFPHRKAAD